MSGIDPNILRSTEGWHAAISRGRERPIDQLSESCPTFTATKSAAVPALAAKVPLGGFVAQRGSGRSCRSGPIRAATTPNSIPRGRGNASRVGYLLSLGAFQFLNLGDATRNVQYALACPENLLGEVDVYQVPHRGNGVAPQLTWALAPTVAVINNGPRKGGSAEGFQVVARSPRLEDVWQSHRPLDTDAAYRADDDLTANLATEDGCCGHWIKATVAPEGRSYSLTNGRNGASRAYLSR